MPLTWLLVTLAALTPARVAVGTSELPAGQLRQLVPPLLVQAMERELQTAGCQRILVTDRQALQAAEVQHWRTMVPADATGAALMVCPPRVAGAIQVAEALTLSDAAWSAANAVTAGGASGLKSILGWSQAYVGGKVKAALEATTQLAWDSIGEALHILFAALGKVALVFMTGLLRFIPILLSLSGFLSHPAVIRLWPFVLSIVNVGFMIALLFIALVTALHLEVGGGWRRLLPRLLLAAILVNFSLVIAGFILDASRVLMALLPQMVSTGSGGTVKISTLGEDILKASRVEGLREVISTGGGETALQIASAKWADAVGALLVAIVRWLLVIALAMVVFNLLIRYVMLLVLLIISPVAYLAVVFPNTSGLARQWWTAFLRYVIYAPAVLFILLALVVSRDFFSGLFDSQDSNELTWEKLLAIVTVIAFIIMAAMAGKFAGLVGSATALAVVASGGRRLRGLAYRGATRGGGAAVRGAYVGLGGRRLVREGRGIGREALRPLRRQLGLGEYSKFDDKGKLKKGKVSAFGVGEKLGRAVERVGLGGPKAREIRNNAQIMRRSIAAPQGMPPADMSALQDREAARRLSKSEVSIFVQNALRAAGDPALTPDERSRATTVYQSITSNVELVRNMNDAAKAAVLSSGDTQAIGQLNRALRELRAEP